MAGLTGLAAAAAMAAAAAIRNPKIGKMPKKRRKAADSWHKNRHFPYTEIGRI